MTRQQETWIFLWSTQEKFKFQIHLEKILHQCKMTPDEKIVYNAYLKSVKSGFEEVIVIPPSLRPKGIFNFEEISKKLNIPLEKMRYDGDYLRFEGKTPVDENVNDFSNWS